MTNQDLNRRFASLVGICIHDEGVWVKWTTWLCEKCGSEVSPDNPKIDFAADPRLVLREMMKREDWDLFAPTVGRWDGSTAEYFIRYDYILDTTGRLRDKAIEWLEKEERCIKS